MSTTKILRTMQQQIFRAFKTIVILLLLTTLGRSSLADHLNNNAQFTASMNGPFPGVSRDLASFCAARPSLPIDLASMIVHVKKDTSFNYKLYLFSTDHVFQTGQVIPRDDFRVHSFPVKFKKISEFWPADVPTYRQVNPNQSNQSVRVDSNQFDFKSFFEHVPLRPTRSRLSAKVTPVDSENMQRNQRHQSSSEGNDKSPKTRVLRMHIHEDAGGEPLPGDPEFTRHDVGNADQPQALAMKLEQSDNFSPNKYIQFDRDDGFSTADQIYGPGATTRTARHLHKSARQQQQDRYHKNDDERDDLIARSSEVISSQASSILPVGAFSSFHVNLTYLVRKDFDQIEPELIRIKVDASKFQITQVNIIGNTTNYTLPPAAWTNETADKPTKKSDNATKMDSGTLSNREDYDFLSHKILRDPNTRITAINQIYEEWITRNHYTIVYIQRRGLVHRVGSSIDDDGTFIGSSQYQLITERLVFRGSSLALVGADQLDYDVKAAAFITEKNGLHYFLEFTPANKFYLSAVDWANRPFRIIDSQRFPIKATRTQFDNEELLLCPPAVCFSRQPIDEIVSYGRLPLSPEIQETISILLNSSKAKQQINTSVVQPMAAMVQGRLSDSGQVQSENKSTFTSPAGYMSLSSLLMAVDDNQLINDTASLTSLSSISNMITELSANWLQTKLHLRDWLWTLTRTSARSSSSPSSSNGLLRDQLRAGIIRAESGPVPIFSWQYEQARRNDVKLNADKYGYVLSGHDIDASFRIYNELYIISENHLITINYSSLNETVTSARPIGDEFSGLSSNLVDPITGAFYDRHTNQIYFFKGDRFIGYDYASKQPLDDFVVDTEVNQQPTARITSPTATTKQTNATNKTQRVVTSLPVIDILGRQLYVDGVHHDLLTDVIYIFSGMKFFTFRADEFKNGAVRYTSNSQEKSKLHCINEHFIEGCHFDEAFQNPCNDNDYFDRAVGFGRVVDGKGNRHSNKLVLDNEQEDPDSDFSLEQQNKLRAIATGNKLLGAIINNEAAIIGRVPLVEAQNNQSLNGQSSTEQLIIYLLVSMIAVTLIATVVIVLIALSWSKPNEANESELQTRNEKAPIDCIIVQENGTNRMEPPQSRDNIHDSNVKDYRQHRIARKLSPINNMTSHFGPKRDMIDSSVL